MNIFDWPADIYPVEAQGHTCGVVPINQSSASARTGAIQVVSRGPAAIWQMSFSIRTQGEKEEAIDQFLSKLEGRLNVCRSPNLLFEGQEIFNQERHGLPPLPNFTLSGNVGRGDNVVNIIAQNTNARIIKIGTPLQIGTRLYRTVNRINGSDPNVQQLQIYPHLRSPHIAGDSVVFNRPLGHWILEADDQVVPEYVENEIYDRSFRFSEDFRNI